MIYNRSQSDKPFSLEKVHFKKINSDKIRTIGINMGMGDLNNMKLNIPKNFLTRDKSSISSEYSSVDRSLNKTP